VLDRKGVSFSSQVPPDTVGAELAADMAATTALIEIGEQIGALHLLEAGQPFAASDLAAAAGIPLSAAAGYLEALAAAVLIVAADVPGSFCAAEDFASRRHEAGYLSWSLRANRPYIDHALEYLRNPVQARQEYPRNGREVALTASWIGERAFYPAVVTTIIDSRPGRLVDLGAGTGSLLIGVLAALPGSTGCAVDVDVGACAEAARAAVRAGVADRLDVVERSIQSLAADPEPLQGANLIHAGFVLHELLPDDEQAFDDLLSTCRATLEPGGMMAVTDSIPYATAERERRFSAWFTYSHDLMGRRLLTTKQWLEKFEAAGFPVTQVRQHRFPAGRLFLAGV
jgi:SAM-dependent methyltransferase